VTEPAPTARELGKESYAGCATSTVSPLKKSRMNFYAPQPRSAGSRREHAVHAFAMSGTCVRSTASTSRSRAKLMELAREAREQGWWTEYDD
jgi:hypothetical protein